MTNDEPDTDLRYSFDIDVIGAPDPFLRRVSAN